MSYPAAKDNTECQCWARGQLCCWYCPYGHATECHYPFTCKEAECDHYFDEQDNEKTNEASP